MSQLSGRGYVLRKFRPQKYAMILCFFVDKNELTSPQVTKPVVLCFYVRLRTIWRQGVHSIYIFWWYLQPSVMAWIICPFICNIMLHFSNIYFLKRCTYVLFVLFGSARAMKCRIFNEHDLNQRFPTFFTHVPLKRKRKIRVPP